MDPISKPSRVLLSAAITGLLSTVGSACDSSSEPSGRIIEVRIEPDMTLEKFTEDCDARDGTVELHATCGGVNTCQGFSYDDATHELTEHTCRGVNTCSGYSCVVPS
jgi:hypothetical protein